VHRNGKAFTPEHARRNLSNNNNSSIRISCIRDFVTNDEFVMLILPIEFRNVSRLENTIILYK